MTVKAPRATEAQCQRTIIDAARRLGWLVHAERPATMQSGRWSTPIQGDAGFPDLVLVHPVKRLVWFVELKRRPYTVKEEQWVWLNALGEAGVHSDIVWVPEQMDQFIVALGAAE